MKKQNRFKLLVALFSLISFSTINAQDNKFKPSFHAGVLLHTYVSCQQNGFNSSSEVSSADDWTASATLYRTRLMTETKLTKNDKVFIETELTSSVGTDADKAVSIKILDAQYDHTFNKALMLSVGKILVSHNRNGLQTASTLMVNDFTYFQYAYNMSSDSPLQNDLGRDIGVNASGILSKKIAYRLGLFSGRRTFDNTDDAPLRIVGRVGYNFFDIDQYSGTNLGEGKTVTLAGGFDTQGTYFAGGSDLYVDYPVGKNGSITLNTAWSYISGGNDLNDKYSFASMIPTQNTQLLELGYYFKSCRLQPWVRYEKQDVNSESNQTSDGLSTNEFNKLNTTTVLGAGINYFFNGYKTNLKFSYVSMKKGVLMDSSAIEDKTYGQIWLQLQLCFF